MVLYFNLLPHDSNSTLNSYLIGTVKHLSGITLSLSAIIRINGDIDPKTQQPTTCVENNTAKVLCFVGEGIICKDGTGKNETTFEKDIECQFTQGYSFETALLLSLFLGMFGIDRFYLGYPAIGLAKLCTLGFMFLGQLVDIILIALQVVGPSDGSHYVISYFGPKLTILKRDNDTYVMPQDDW